MALRRCVARWDQTHGPHKFYKYSYVPDPRKLLPIERVAAHEVHPQPVRPPNAHTPTVEAFLAKCDIHRRKPTSDFKATFTDWNDLMTCSKREMCKRGVPRRTRHWIRNSVRAFHNGTPPERYDTKEEWLFFKQFKTKDHSYRVIPELPEKYRPHQSGIDQPPMPDLVKINAMPEWALREEERLRARLTKPKT